MKTNLQEFADTVDSICYDFDAHHISKDYEFFGGLTLQMLVNACKFLKETGEVDFSEDWIDQFQ